MSEHQCVIGLLYERDTTRLITYSKLLEYIQNEESMWIMLKDDPVYRTMVRKPLKINQYCDGRRSTNLVRFKHCPDCGKQINWKQYRKESTE